MFEGRRGPVHTMLMRVRDEGALRFHMPGHKGLTDLPGAAVDLTELPGTDTLGEPSAGILEAQNEAARRWRASRSFLLVNGSTAGVQAMVLWASVQGRQLLLPRDCHSSAVYACAIAGIQPVWLERAWNVAEQLTQWDADCMIPALPEGKAAIFLTYPDYYGRCIDLNDVKAKLAGRNAALLIDSAHGAHFAFSSKLPADAGIAADAWVSGAHKTLPAPTQTAFLHVRDAEHAGDFARLLRGVTTTSPSFLLLAGLDDARAAMDASACALDELVDNCMRLAERLNRLPGLRCWDDADARSTGHDAHDPTRLVVDVRGLGVSGWEAGAQLRDFGVQAEMCDIYRIVLIATVMDGPARLEQLYLAFERLAAERRGKHFCGGVTAAPARGEAAMTLRQAWLSPAFEVPLEDAAGRVAAEPFGAYPPGIPLAMPGEVITKDAIETVREAAAQGGGLFGIRQGRVMVVI